MIINRTSSKHLGETCPFDNQYTTSISNSSLNKWSPPAAAAAVDG